MVNEASVANAPVESGADVALPTRAEEIEDIFFYEIHQERDFADYCHTAASKGRKHWERTLQVRFGNHFRLMWNERLKLWQVWVVHGEFKSRVFTLMDGDGTPWPFDNRTINILAMMDPRKTGEGTVLRAALKGERKRKQAWDNRLTELYADTAVEMAKAQGRWIISTHGGKARHSKPV